MERQSSRRNRVGCLEGEDDAVEVVGVGSSYEERNEAELLEDERGGGGALVVVGYVDEEAGRADCPSVAASHSSASAYRLPLAIAGETGGGKGEGRESSWIRGGGEEEWRQVSITN